MIGWKQAYTVDLQNTVLVKLEIPDEARICHIKKGKSLVQDRWRCDRARVLAITSFDGKHRLRKARSLRADNDYQYLIYKVGEEVRPSSYCGDARKKCAAGLYFFQDKKEALLYEY